MAVAPQTEPWSALLKRGRADERLVHESSVPPRAGHAVPIPGILPNHRGWDDFLANLAVVVDEAHAWRGRWSSEPATST
jgi:hypothetical protein